MKICEIDKTKLAPMMAHYVELKENYKDVIIAGSTITTKGYQGAILNAFKAVKIFEGGAN